MSEDFGIKWPTEREKEEYFAKMRVEHDELKAKNAALIADLKEMTRLRDHWRKMDIDRCKQFADALGQISALTAELAEMRKRFESADAAKVEAMADLRAENAKLTAEAGRMREASHTIVSCWDGGNGREADCMVRHIEDLRKALALPEKPAPEVKP